MLFTADATNYPGAAGNNIEIRVLRGPGHVSSLPAIAVDTTTDPIQDVIT